MIFFLCNRSLYKINDWVGEIPRFARDDMAIRWLWGLKWRFAYQLSYISAIHLQIATSAHFYVPEWTVIPNEVRDLLHIFTEAIKKADHTRDLLLIFTEAIKKTRHSRDLPLIITKAIKNVRHSRPTYNFVHQFLWQLYLKLGGYYF